ncbi:hypothetical protein M5G25_31065 [Pseudomonas sp. TNT2022 ID357]|uniref:Plasmid related protein n=1 Tax=Pseudomonas idahonensis TaxID=2942628 RepID=A0ABT5QEU9_9PSED|nr:hypothetical protein [Pseudomonas idahonensis]MDD1152714.1 hypothetical protein [Pseudomonas idahonensis]
MKTGTRKTKSGTLFPIGALVFSKGVDQLVREGRLDPMPYVRRHACGDWGAGDDFVWQANNAAVRTGERLDSFYLVASGLQILIITNAERSSTRVQLNGED